MVFKSLSDPLNAPFWGRVSTNVAEASVRPVFVGLTPGSQLPLFARRRHASLAVSVRGVEHAVGVTDDPLVPLRVRRAAVLEADPQVTVQAVFVDASAAAERVAGLRLPVLDVAVDAVGLVSASAVNLDLFGDASGLADIRKV